MARINHINISIDNPCSEDFNAMKKTGIGNYCNSCKTEVVDFTKMTDAQVLNYLESKNYNVPCGRFKAQQLDRKLFNPNPEPFINWSKLRGAFYALFLVPISFFDAKAQVKAENKIEQVENLRSEEQVETIHITGKLLLNGEPLPYRTIEIIQLGYTTKTDELGQFSIHLYERHRNDDLTIIARGLVYEFEPYYFNVQEHLKNKTEILINKVAIKHDPLGILGGISICAPTITLPEITEMHLNKTNKKKSFFRRLFKRR